MSDQKQIRTTISLPAGSLAAAKRVAKSRKVKLSTVVAEALEESMKKRRTKERVEAVIESYRRAFAGFSDEELMVLDGIVLEPKRSRA